MTKYCSAFTKKGRPCSVPAHPGFDVCHGHRPKHGPQHFETTTCYGCLDYTKCADGRLTDGTWAWLCVDRCYGTEIVPILQRAGGSLGQGTLGI